MKKIIIIIILSLLFPEKFIYSLGFKFINVGEAVISSNIKNENEIRINTIIASNKFFDKLYKLRDEVDLVVDSKDFSLKKIDKNVLEGTWKKQYNAEIDSDFNIVSKNKVTQNDKLLFDPISVVYNLRTQDLKIGDKYEFNILGIDEVRPIVIEVKKIETVKVPAGKYKCKKVVPYSNDGKSIFKENGYMTVWFSNDTRKIPVQIVQKTNIGNITLKLKKIIP